MTLYFLGFWRQETVRIREILANVEYKTLRPNRRRRRILDDTWAHMYNSVSQAHDWELFITNHGAANGQTCTTLYTPLH
jgi:hypothetical protein